MSSSPTGCCAAQWAIWKGGGGALPPVTGLPLRIIVLSQFPTPVPVMLNDGKIQLPYNRDTTFQKGGTRSGNHTK